MHFVSCAFEMLETSLAPFTAILTFLLIPLSTGPTCFLVLTPITFLCLSVVLYWGECLVLMSLQWNLRATSRLLSGNTFSPVCVFSHTMSMGGDKKVNFLSSYVSKNTFFYFTAWVPCCQGAEFHFWKSLCLTALKQYIHCLLIASSLTSLRFPAPWARAGLTVTAFSFFLSFFKHLCFLSALWQDGVNTEMFFHF